MKSKVFRVKTNHSDTLESVKQKLTRLIDVSDALSCIERGDQSAVKIHFGEEGNTGFVSPSFVGVICRGVLKKNGAAFLSDTNTLYTGRRTNSRDHLKLALEHGFSETVTGVALNIPDDTVPGNTVEVPLNLQHVKTAYISLPFMRAQALVGIAHFKGHVLTGFGGALKNIGMGCATRKGKLAQHSDVSPFVAATKCTGCRSCIRMCPANAITVHKEKAVIDSTKCIGCASCLAVCTFYALEIDWESGGKRAPMKIIEYAKAVLDKKQGKTAFFNFATHITAECDCLAKDDPAIAPDAGILASCDPVAIDKASYDLVIKQAGKDVFKEAHPHRDGMPHLEYAASLKLGNIDYELIEV
jgi:uncharacterized protein